MKKQLASIDIQNVLEISNIQSISVSQINQTYGVSLA